MNETMTDPLNPMNPLNPDIASASTTASSILDGSMNIWSLILLLVCLAALILKTIHHRGTIVEKIRYCISLIPSALSGSVLQTMTPEELSMTEGQEESKSKVGMPKETASELKTAKTVDPQQEHLDEDPTSEPLYPPQLVRQQACVYE